MFFHGWVGGRGFGAHFAQVDFVLLTDFLQYFVVELLEHFFEDLYAADELSILISALNFPQDVVLVVGFDVVQGLLAGDDIFLY